MITFTEGPGKLSTLEIFQECLLFFDQLQQRSGHVNVLVCRLVFSRLIVFFLSRNTITFQKYFAVHGFLGLTVN